MTPGRSGGDSSASVHSHDASDLQAASRRGLWIALALIAAYVGAEVVGGLAANSLALLADAGHMATDVGALSLALLAAFFALRPPSTSRTFGFQRAEVLAASLNALSLLVIAVWILLEAYRRFAAPPEVTGPIVLAVGTGGLVVNVGAALVLRRSARQNLNVEGAFLHVLGDLLGSVGVVVSAVLVLTLDWRLADPLAGAAIAAFIVVGAVRMLRRVLHILLQGTPAHLDIGRLCERFEGCEGVAGIHDIHAWSLTTGYDVLSAHVTVTPKSMPDSERVLEQLRSIAEDELGPVHVTVQIEGIDAECEEAHHIPH